MKKDYSNIFEAAGEGSPKKKIPTPPPQEKGNKPLEPVSDEELLSTLNQMRNIQKEIETKLESLYERSGLSPKSLEQYLEIFSALSGPARKAVEKEGKQLEEQITAVVGRAEVKTKKITSDKSSQAKDRKSKTIGSRKRWLNMH